MPNPVMGLRLQGRIDTMTAKNAKSSVEKPMLLYDPPDIPMAAIRRYARQIAEKFQPDKIILFGSYAYGKPNQDSDVDLLVVMPARNHIDQAVRITVALDAPFPLDLIVRRPTTLKQRIKDGDSFLEDIVTNGKVLYEKGDSQMGAQGRSRHQSREKVQARNRTYP